MSAEIALEVETGSEHTNKLALNAPLEKFWISIHSVAYPHEEPLSSTFKMHNIQLVGFEEGLLFMLILEAQKC
jgi:hypothetical protein